MTKFFFQTQYPESSDRLNRAAKLIKLDINDSILIIQFNFDAYDGVETRINLDTHMFRQTQNIEITTEEHKYHTIATPMIRRCVNENIDEVEYLIYAITEDE